MKILIDECLPKKLKHTLPEHSVVTVQEIGWSGKKNGELLRLMTGQFDVFITNDQNMQYQHNLDTLAIAFIVLIAPNSKFESLQPLMPEVAKALVTLQAGQVVEIREPA